MAAYVARRGSFLREPPILPKQERAVYYSDFFCCHHPALGEKNPPVRGGGTLLSMKKECHAIV